MINKTDLAKDVEEILGAKTWGLLTKEGQNLIVDRFDRLYQKETKKVENTLKEIRERRRSQNTLLLGIIIGISGGLLGNIIDRHLLHFGLLYEVIAAVFFIGLIITVNRAYSSVVSEIYKSNKTLSLLLKKAENKLTK